MKLKTYPQALDYLNKQIPKGIKQKFPGELGLKRTKYFLKLIGSPQEKVKTIHVAGTSGKGSTAYLTSILLRSLGFRVGLSLSPHLEDLRERIQINNQFISKNKFVIYLNKLIPFLRKMKFSRYGPATYFEILIALAFYIFHKQEVDFAVMETGLGGWYDATNSAINKLCILTKIGFDHTEVLGNELSAIAYHKAKIIQKHNITVVVWQKKLVNKTIETAVEEKKGNLYWQKKETNFSNIRVSKRKTVFNWIFNKVVIKNLELNLLGNYQAENCSLALASVLLLSQKHNFVFNVKIIRKTLAKAYFPGRFEIIKTNGKKLIVDVAHNPQKMTGFIDNLKVLYPMTKFTFLLAFKQSKDYKTMLKIILPLANNFILTKFFVKNQDLHHLSVNPALIKHTLIELGFNQVKIINDPHLALQQAIKSNNLVITGSIYLLGEIYKLIRSETLALYQYRSLLP